MRNIGTSRCNERAYVKYIFILPAMAFFLVALVIPFFSGINIAFTNWDGLKADYDFVWFDNFKRMATDLRLHQSLRTVSYTHLDVYKRQNMICAYWHMTHTPTRKLRSRWMLSTSHWMSCWKTVILSVSTYQECRKTTTCLTIVHFQK